MCGLMYAIIGNRIDNIKLLLNYEADILTT